MALREHGWGREQQHGSGEQHRRARVHAAARTSRAESVARRIVDASIHATKLAELKATRFTPATP